MELEPVVKKMRCAAWKHMVQVSSDTVQCQICNRLLKFSKSTTTMTRHIKARHPTEFAKLEEPCEREERVAVTAFKIEQLPSTPPRPVKLSLSEKIGRPKKYKPRAGSDKKMLLDQLVVGMICTDMQPLSIVEDLGFKKLIHALDPTYSLPSQLDITHKLLPNLYKENKDWLRKQLEVTSSVSVTTEMWFSQETEGHYMTVMAHFITKEWFLRSVVLDTAMMPIAPTAESIADELYRIIDSWNLNEKVTCIVTDNSENMTNACNILNVRWMPCLAHTLNLVVQKAMIKTGEMAEMIEKIKDIVTLFHHNVKASDKLENLQVTQGKTPHKLIQDNSSQWNTSFYMMQRFLELQQFVSGALRSIGKSDLIMNNHDTKQLDSYIKALQPFETATREMSGEKFTTLSKTMPMVKSLMNYLEQLYRSSGSSLAKELSDQLEHHFSDLEENFFPASATLLDPRFKNMAFSDLSSYQNIETQLQAMMKPDEPQLEASQATDQEDESPEESSFWSFLDLRVKGSTSSSTKSTTGSITEFKQYYEECLIKRHDDPLLWWKRRGPFLPKLRDLARQFLSVPATAVPSERLYSKSGELISLKRSSLKEDHIEQIVFLNKNL